MGSRVRVKFNGGREVVGVLNGFDQLLNVVLGEAVEYLRNDLNPAVLSGQSRALGTLVARGPTIAVITPEDGMEQVASPFEQAKAAAAAAAAAAEDA